MCKPCIAGKYSSATGATSASTCTACSGSGYYIPADGASCLQCSSGKYFTSVSTACQKCPAGTYNDQTGLTQASQCKACGSGEYTMSTAMYLSCILLTPYESLICICMTDDDAVQAHSATQAADHKKALEPRRACAKLVAVVSTR